MAANTQSFEYKSNAADHKNRVFRALSVDPPKELPLPYPIEPISEFRDALALVEEVSASLALSYKAATTLPNGEEKTKIIDNLENALAKTENIFRCLEGARAKMSRFSVEKLHGCDRSKLHFV